MVLETSLLELDSPPILLGIEVFWVSLLALNSFPIEAAWLFLTLYIFLVIGVEYLFLNIEALEVSLVELNSSFAVVACCSLDVVLGSGILEISLLELDSFLVS